MKRGELERIGEVIGGRYRIDQLLSQGGQAAVFAGTDVRHGDEVVLKLLTGERAQDPEWRERMFREVQAMVRLGGTAAVRVFDQRWSDRGELCLIMERLHGVDLADYLKERAEKGERLDLPEVLRLLGPVADTLEIAHEAGILHRDLKPENLFVTEAGVRVLDFGFVRFTFRKGLTQPGFAAGSPSYMAPEVWLGAENFDRRVDVYGLGAIVFRALAGRPPFVAPNLAEVFKAVTRAPRPSLHALRDDLPVEIDDWVEHALAVDPETRFSRVGAMWNALGALATRASRVPET